MVAVYFASGNETIGDVKLDYRVADYNAVNT